MEDIYAHRFNADGSRKVGLQCIVDGIDYVPPYWQRPPKSVTVCYMSDMEDGRQLGISIKSSNFKGKNEIVDIEIDGESVDRSEWPAFFGAAASCVYPMNSVGFNGALASIVKSYQRI